MSFKLFTDDATTAGIQGALTISDLRGSKTPTSHSLVKIYFISQNPSDRTKAVVTWMYRASIKIENFNQRFIVSCGHEFHFGFNTFSYTHGKICKKKVGT